MATKNQVEEMLLTLDEAQEKFLEAISLVESIVGTDSHISTYWIDRAKIMASNDHGFINQDINLDDIKMLVEEDPEKFIR